MSTWGKKCLQHQLVPKECKCNEVQSKEYLQGKKLAEGNVSWDAFKVVDYGEHELVGILFASKGCKHL